MRVACDVDETTMQNEDGYDVDGVEVTCGRCGHTTESFGTSGASIRRCLVLMRQECPRGEANYYVAEGSDDD